MASITKKIDGKSIELYLDNILLLKHSDSSPAIFVGEGTETVKMYRGNFDIKDRHDEKIPLRYFEDKDDSIRFYYGEDEITLSFAAEGGSEVINLQASKDYSRFWIRFVSNKDEHIYGLGEQMSHFNLRGKLFPVWSSEPGVGRNKQTNITWQADVMGMAGGDYYNTNYPQPSYMSSQKYYALVDSFAYSEFDFRDESFHEINVWEVPSRIMLWKSDNYKSLMESFTSYIGRQEEVPSWVDNGFMVGLQGGFEKSDNIVDTLLEHGVSLCGVWAQDWQGIRMTSFGQRLMWNWAHDPIRYPNFKEKVAEYQSKGIKFLAYTNCYLAVDAPLFQECKELGYLAKDKDGNIYEVDFGEFYCGVPDLTRQEVKEWFAERIIVKEMLDYGVEGWMADFGEYLPTDCVLENGTAMKRHNQWPTLWAEVNDIALRKANKRGEVFIFMRAAGTYAQKYCPILWAGDQCVDFSKDDGLATVIPAALSSGVSGFAFHHSDLGGYTSLFGNVRTPELNMRWAEFAAFTAVMRSHETNRPKENTQVYESSLQMTLLAKMVRIFKALAPYRRIHIKEGSEKGIPLMRPLFFEYPDDAESYNIDYEYMLGSDVLVAPVWQEDKKSWDVYLPTDKWVHLWSGKEYDGGQIVSVESGVGFIPVFYKASSSHKDLFVSIKNL